MLLIGIIFFTPVSAEDAITEILEKTYLDFAHELEYINLYVPDEHVQNSGHIHGWIDIVGYDNLTMIEGEYYIPGAPENHVIIEHDKWESADGWNTGVDEFTETISVKNTDGVITVSNEIYLLWHTSTLRCRGYPPHCWIHKDYYEEYATFHDSEITPLIFIPLNCSNTSIEVIIYNNTISPKTTLKILEVPENTLSINYTYDNESIVHYLGAATQEHTEKNCPYMLITHVDIWKSNGNLSHLNDFVIIPSMNFSSNNLTVIATDPYSFTEINNITIYELKYHGHKDTFSSLFWVFILIVGIFAIGSYYQIRRLQWK